MIRISYHIVASAIVSKARGDTPNLTDLSWSEVSQEAAMAAGSYIDANITIGKLVVD